MYRFAKLSFCLVLAATACTSASAATVDFEVFALGTQYGTPAAHAPGDLVLSQDGIDMTVENFTSGSFTGFNLAEISGHPGPPTSFFPAALNPTQALTLNNINGRFDFTSLPIGVTKVSFDYADLGGANNFDVNGLGKQETSDLTTLGSYVNYNVAVSAAPIGGGVAGTIEVTAALGHQIKTLEIGGQELSIDNMHAVPEPTALALALVGFAGVLARRRAQ